ncbi:hypothetical protein F5Y10DRAFT_147318 [Nemania abortiva]|nr:hypothetical protein F5Y10DRAFT_147318 [Nemania abortiva]
MASIRFLTASHVLRMHYTHIFPLPLNVEAEKRTASRRVENPLLQPSYLESALASPHNHHHYAGTTNLYRLAALVAEKIALDHPFYDGNKRTALFSADMFLRINSSGGIRVRHNTPTNCPQLLNDTTPALDGQSLPKLSSKEQALADAMVDIATRKINSDELCHLIKKIEHISGA